MGYETSPERPTTMTKARKTHKMSPLRLLRAAAILIVFGIFVRANAIFVPQVNSPLYSFLESAQDSRPAKLVRDGLAAAASVLQVFQVYPPVLTPVRGGTAQALTNGSDVDSAAVVDAAATGCVRQQTLMVHEFANSYNQPFVGQYTPPKGCKFNRVTINFTATARGRQFDRLAVAYFGDVEIWRTSTAEPTQNGIVWTYIKDMSHYLALFQQPQKLIFDLGNIVNDVYTAPFETTLTATFFTGDDTVDPADAILPISAQKSGSNAASAWQVPPSTAASSLKLPRNVRRAVVSVSATGQIDEEFWFGNVFSSQVNTFPKAGTLLGYSPFREVQLLIDGQLAGVIWPFPIIFTGGVVPGLWRPVVGIDAFDLREDEIDISPFLPLLCDGKAHTFSILIAGIADDGKGHGTLTTSVGSYWVVTGKVFLWLDTPGAITTGSALTASSPPPSISISSSLTKNSTGGNQTLTYDTAVSRTLSLSSVVRTSNGSRTASWTQTLQYANHGHYTQAGLRQLTQQSTNGTDTASSGYSRQIAYPVTVDTKYVTKPSGAFTINATLDRGQRIAILGLPTFPTGLQSFETLPATKGSGPEFQGSLLQTSQQGSAFYQSNPNNSIATSYGTTAQDMLFAGTRTGSFESFQGSTELYRRSVKAVNASVVMDQESLVGRPVGGFNAAVVPSAGALEFAAGGVRRILGRGPAL